MMKQDILIKLNSKNGRVEILTARLGINGENLQGNIVMEFIDEFIDGTAVLEFKRNEEKYYLVMNKENNKYTLPILSSLLTETCVIDFQLRITVGTGENVPVWKSNIFYLKVEEAINSTTTIPEEYESWIDIANESSEDIELSFDSLISISGIVEWNNSYSKHNVYWISSFTGSSNERCDVVTTTNGLSFRNRTSVTVKLNLIVEYTKATD